MTEAERNNIATIKAAIAQCSGQDLDVVDAFLKDCLGPDMKFFDKKSMMLYGNNIPFNTKIVLNGDGSYDVTCETVEEEFKKMDAAKEKENAGYHQTTITSETVTDENGNITTYIKHKTAGDWNNLGELKVHKKTETKVVNGKVETIITEEEFPENTSHGMVIIALVFMIAFVFTPWWGIAFVPTAHYLNNKAIEEGNREHIASWIKQWIKWVYVIAVIKIIVFLFLAKGYGV